MKGSGNVRFSEGLKDAKDAKGPKDTKDVKGMQERHEETLTFKIVPEESVAIDKVLVAVYHALKEKGYNPVDQIVGYLLSGDPTYITSYNNARNLIRKIERDELLEELVRSYIMKHNFHE